ncbi:MAG: hypothetical protein GY708_10705 [Actinomycetia bacterium]|nr:hypothetical protein [Actinomycetes bacterium]MCP4960828.1 hypothetical protein [Actinomycetes bacterium]
MYSRSDAERGSVSIVMVAVVAVAALMLAGVSRVGDDAVSAARARVGADAAALAAAQDGDTSARRVAAADRVELVSVLSARNEVTVVVSVDGHQAVATAKRVLFARETGERQGLAPAMLAALARVDELLGSPVPVVSGYRSPAHQQRLWDVRQSNPYPVARPGTSRHELGLAVDVPLSFVSRLVEIASTAGLCHPLPVDDPVHFIVCPNPR